MSCCSCQISWMERAFLSFWHAEVSAIRGMFSGVPIGKMGLYGGPPLSGTTICMRDL